MESVRRQAGDRRLLSAAATVKCWKDFRGKGWKAGRKEGRRGRERKRIGRENADELPAGELMMQTCGAL